MPIGIQGEHVNLSLDLVAPTSTAGVPLVIKDTNNQARPLQINERLLIDTLVAVVPSGMTASLSSLATVSPTVFTFGIGSTGFPDGVSASAQTGTIAVADSSNNRYDLYNDAGVLLGSPTNIGSVTGTNYTQPIDTFFTANGNLVIANNVTSPAVYIGTLSGTNYTVLTTLSGQTFNSNGLRLVTEDFAGRILVAENLSGQGRISRFDGTTGVLIDASALDATGGYFGVAANPAGGYWATSPSTGLIEVFNASLVKTGTLAPAGIISPQGIVLGPDGNLYISIDNSGVLISTTSGVALGMVPSGSRPWGARFDSSGRLLVAETFQVQRFSGVAGYIAGGGPPPVLVFSSLATRFYQVQEGLSFAVGVTPIVNLSATSSGSVKLSGVGRIVSVSQTNPSEQSWQAGQQSNLSVP